MNLIETQTSLHVKENSEALAAALDYCHKYLPHQGRLEDFIHHNTLHAFTDRPFDTAVLEAWALYGNIPYPKLRDFHEWLVHGEIEKKDLFKIIEDEVPDILNKDFQLGSTSLPGMELVEVLMSESAPFKFPFFEIYGRKFRNAEKVFHKWNRLLLRLSDQGKLDIWIPNLLQRTFFSEKSRIFHEALDETYGLVLRCFSTYCDQGVRQIELPEKDEGLLQFFFTYFKRAPLFARSWRKLLSKNIEIFSQKYGPHGAGDILLDVLTSTGIPPREWKHYLFSILYKFKGWGALIVALDKKEKKLFFDFAAILALCDLSKIQDNYKSHVKKIEAIGKRLPSCQSVQKIYENNLRGVIRYLLSKQRSVRDLMQIKEEELLPLFETCLTFHNFFKRKLFQKALDQKSERDFLGAVLSCKTNMSLRPQPQFIALCCIDEREESFRRHLEECEPRAQTEATAGHFSLNIEFQAYRRSHYRKLCPAPQTPFVRVREVASSEINPILNYFGKITLWIERALLHPVYGTLITLSLSPFISMGLFFRIFFPLKYKAMRTWLVTKLFTSEWKSEFVLESQEQNYEMRLTKALAETLITSGLKDIKVPYVFIVGHGSTSLNNPHEAAHDCGACAGGRGWPNARLFAELANRTHIRKTLLTLGVTIDPHTRFVGSYHNTSSDDVEFMDVFEPIPHDLKAHMEALRLAARKDALERNRRFLDYTIAKNIDQAKTAIVRRSLALDQVRPEYGHATNAYLVIGPRELTRGLFMDRRGFLCSYNFRDDPDGRYLKGILSTIVPVCVGINLEYYFSWVDKQGYGCDTKIPHNINGLNGVMNGYMSDLLLGLPLQMTEIHRPVRLKILVEAPLSWVQAVLRDVPEIQHEIENEWFYFSVLDPEKGSVFSWSHDHFKEVQLPKMNLPIYKNSLDYINGARDYVGFALRKYS